ncbi:MAG: FHA domain-containing protein [Chitinophagales bacterium]
MHPKGFTKCEKGHFFKEDLLTCPFCPSVGASGSGDGPTQLRTADSSSNGDTIQSRGGDGDHDKTRIMGPGGNNSTKGTEVYTGNASSASSKSSAANSDRTFIGGITDASEGDGKEQESAPRASRKLVGWLVSYTFHDMGIDYRLYEGNNTIGRDTTNSISIDYDKLISAKHATLLFKKGKYYLKDEMAANGSFINNEELEIGKPYTLEDGDKLKLGGTEFTFKSAL